MLPSPGCCDHVGRRWGKDVRVLGQVAVVLCAALVVGTRGQSNSNNLTPDESEWGWRWCFVCTDSGPDTQCERDAAQIIHGINHLNCTKPYCTVTRIEHGGEVWSFERGCHSRNLGTGCSFSHEGEQKYCTYTCDQSWCNSGPGLPPDDDGDGPRRKPRRRKGGHGGGGSGGERSRDGKRRQRRKRRKNGAPSGFSSSSLLLVTLGVIVASFV